MGQVGTKMAPSWATWCQERSKRAILALFWEPFGTFLDGSDIYRNGRSVETKNTPSFLHNFPGSGTCFESFLVPYWRQAEHLGVTFDHIALEWRAGAPR